MEKLLVILKFPIVIWIFEHKFILILVTTVYQKSMTCPKTWLLWFLFEICQKKTWSFEKFKMWKITKNLASYSLTLILTDCSKKFICYLLVIFLIMSRTLRRIISENFWKITTSKKYKHSKAHYFKTKSNSW